MNIFASNQPIPDLPTANSLNLDIPKHFQIQVSSIADPQAIVQVGPARFTMLTSRLIRMEYNPAGTFEDRPSQVFWHRLQPVPPFQVRQGADALEIITSHLHLLYTGGNFSSQSLFIQLLANGFAWHFGEKDTRNLLGTARTLDQADGQVALEPGLLSRAGWGLVDDTRGLVFNPQGWLEARHAPPEALDVYFFGYGRAYQEGLADYSKIAGPVPLIPRWALGNWWSRFWAYSDQELLDLMNDFKNHQVPLSVCIIDMDWHITQTRNASRGWTGYTWNSQLFPDPQAFLASLHALGLKTSLNLHPADGVYPHEEAYPQMAKALGIDPASQQPVQFNLEDPRFTKAYFEILHHPQEAGALANRDGIDFWWMDWQQGNPTSLPGLNLLWWINHLHFHDLGRAGNKRSFIFSRWGGLGSHRYPIGFSGDTVVSWDSLAFQPYFTATAANVAYNWWSHDIGGHMDGVEDAELYTRWVQFGLFSPILRMHSTKNPFHERRPWGYDAETLRVTRHAMQFRHALIPYLYSMSWRNHMQGIPLIQPMYHLEPDREEAYACPNQYAFGSELIAAPFIKPQDPDTRLSRQTVWLPIGDWFDFFSGRYFRGGGWQAVYGSLEDIPIFARAGAIAPLALLPGWGGVENPPELTLHIFPGADNRFELYEDDGVSNAYLQDAYAITPLSQEWSEECQVVRVGPAQNQLDLIPRERIYNLVFHNIVALSDVQATINGSSTDFASTYDPQLHSLTLSGIRIASHDLLKVCLTAASGSLAVRQDPRLEILQKMVAAFHLHSEVKVVLVSRFTDFIADPSRLAAFQGVLTGSQLRALLEVLTGAGVDQLKNAGEELVILWNNQENPAIVYSLAIERSRKRPLQERFSLERSALPHFKAIRPATEWGRTPATLKASYWDVYQVSIG